MISTLRDQLQATLSGTHTLERELGTAAKEWLRKLTPVEKPR